MESKPHKNELSADPTIKVSCEPRDYLDTIQASQYLGLSKQYLEIARHKGGGPAYVKLARAVRYRREDLDIFMASKLRQNTGEMANG